MGAFSHTNWICGEIYSRAVQFVGAAQSVGLYFDDYIETESQHPFGWAAQLAAAGALVLPAARLSGVIQMSSGATASGAAGIASASPLARSIGTSKWYWASRLRFTTAIDAQTFMGVGLADAVLSPTDIFTIGIHGDISTVNFTARQVGAGTASIDLGVAIDTNTWHLFELYCKSDSTIYARVDRGTEQSVAMGTLPSAEDTFGFLTARNGSTAADRVMQVDYSACLYPRDS